MAARTSMSDLLLTLRGLTAAGTAEYTVGTASYWTDQQLQDVLDRHVYAVRSEELQPLETMEAGGSISYYDYQSPRRFFETTSGGTARFVVQDETYTTIGTASWTADYPRGRVTFGTTTAGKSRYLIGYSYDLNSAAADVWSQKAAHYVTAYDVSTDNHSLKRSQIIANCLTMAKAYAAGAQIYTVSIDRSDTGQNDYATDR
jgi:hypothetical protein